MQAELGVGAPDAKRSERKLDGEAVERLAKVYQEIIEDNDDTVSDDPMGQLEAAAGRRLSILDERSAPVPTGSFSTSMTCAALPSTVQAMVFGNRGALSGAGVAFSRDPSTGRAEPVIDVLFDSQGEDVVSGSRTPDSEEAICRWFPAVAAQLRKTLVQLKHEFGDVQDVEFTIEDGKLWILQTRSAKRTPQAALRFAIDLLKEGRITPSQALQRVNGLDVNALEHRHLIASGEPTARGTGASTGIAVGRAAFNSESAERLSTGADPVILVRPDTSTADVEGFAVSRGIVTAVGGRTAHAALVARQMGKPCIVGCAGLEIDVENRRRQAAWCAHQRGRLAVDRRRGGNDLSPALRCRGRTAGRGTGGNRTLADASSREGGGGGGGRCDLAEP